MTSNIKVKLFEKDKRRALQWDEFAADFAPMQVDAAWFAEMQTNHKETEKRERMGTLRFYLKVIYWVAVRVFNYSKTEWTFIQFELPPMHMEDWLKIDESTREMLFRELRFCHVNGIGAESNAPGCANSFIMMGDQLTMGMIGHLDNIFIARHGVQLPVGSIKCRQAIREEALMYLETRIRIDQALYQKAKSDNDDDNDKGRLESLKNMVVSAVKLKKELQALDKEKEDKEKKDKK